jgi:hypothetical protein
MYGGFASSGVHIKPDLGRTLDADCYPIPSSRHSRCEGIRLAAQQYSWRTDAGAVNQSLGIGASRRRSLAQVNVNHPACTPERKS